MCFKYYISDNAAVDKKVCSTSATISWKYSSTVNGSECEVLWRVAGGSSSGRLLIPMDVCVAVLKDLKPSTRYNVVVRDVKSKYFISFDITTTGEICYCACFFLLVSYKNRVGLLYNVVLARALQ